MSGESLDTSKTAWISQGFERLVARVRGAPDGIHFDVVIVGSGYGGAIAAATLAGQQRDGAPVTVGVLERGQEYLPGAFPTGLSELPGHVRLDRNKSGLFDIRLGPEVTTVIANGVGGGSLINAGVMEVPLPSVFQMGWPSQLKDVSTWISFFDRSREMLGAGINGAKNTIVDHVDGVPQKFQSIAALAPTGTFRPAAITVAMKSSVSSGNVHLNKCVRCGDCATGCNFGAKNSLDVNLLARAQQHGAEIFSGATVLCVERDPRSGWIVNCVYTDAKLRERDHEVFRVRARKVVLAAGTLGSSEILLRSRESGLQLSEQLGRRCSTNGDMLVTDYATTATVNTVADESVQPSARAVGPTITGVIDLRATAGVVIEELSVPAGLRLAFTEVFATVNSLHSSAETDFSRHRRGFPTDDIYVAPAERIESSAVYAVMGDDGAAGRIELVGKATPERDGLARIRWGGLQDLRLFDKQVNVLAGLTKPSGGRVIPNPVWKLLPPELAWLINDRRGPLTTVHPLGGCAMGNNGATGVVDQYGRVFTTNTSDMVHDGLVVLDGSIIPTALGTNPSLTISAVALRAAEALAAEWNYVKRPTAAAGAPLVRPVYRFTDSAAVRPATEVEIVERLVGPVQFARHGDVTESHVVELTLRFSPKALARLTPSNGDRPSLQVATNLSEPLLNSKIRVFPQAKWDLLERTWQPPRMKEEMLDAIAEFKAPLTGTLRILERQESCFIGRIWRAGTAWLLNRGLRDIYQAFVDGDGGPGFCSRLKSGFALASRAGEVRAFVYDLTIGTPDDGAKIALRGDKIVGTKTLTYSRRSNPWRQLMEMNLEQFPGLVAGFDHRKLTLDPHYLAQIGVPLFRTVRERDGVSALGELVTFLGYVLRLVLGLHAWSFRAPDNDPKSRKAPDYRPPSALSIPDGAPVEARPCAISLAPEIPAGGGDAVAGNVLLTRYPNPGTTKPPVVMFHGYSAAGTTFAHPAVNPNLASYLWKTGREIWIADLRTSPRQQTAKGAWSFDQIGLGDIPAVLNKVAGAHGTVDVVAHCMGTVCFSIAVLAGKLRPNLVNRAAFTQVGPLVVFSPANIFRGYALSYLLGFLPESYSFAPDNPTLADELWDRLLSTLPYPIEEFDIENPVWPTKRTPWTRTRHRMDALYGRAFNVVNMEPDALRSINDFFGSINLKTLASTIQFVRYSLMTDFYGHNQYVSRQNFESCWKFPTISVHGGQNGLAHVSTVDRMRQILEDAGCTYARPFINCEAGHQDALIGTPRVATFAAIARFLDAGTTPSRTRANKTKTAYPPWIGPIVTEERDKTSALIVRVGSLPALRAAEGALMLRVNIVEQRISRIDDPAKEWDLDYIVNHMVVYTSEALEVCGWDAFKAPLPQFMPGDNPARRGNALLLLLVYDEPAALFLPPDDQRREYGYFYAVMNDKLVYLHRPDSAPETPPSQSHNFLFDRFLAMAQAAKDALASHNPVGSSASTLRLLVDRGRQLTDAAELQTSSPATDDVEPALSFGYGLDDTSLVEPPQQDRDLVEGAILCDAREEDPTKPLPSGTSFAFASCQYPAGFVDQPIAYNSYGEIVRRLETKAGITPRFTLFVGDQVYVDPTAGLYDPTAVRDRYRLPYEAWLRARNVRDLLRRIPSFMLLDDHEIDDNWEPVATPDTENNDKMKTFGLAAFNKYQRGITSGLETFVFDGFHFFMLDTRTRRTHRRVGELAEASLFDSATMTRLKDWLLTAPSPKFVVSPAMLLPRHRRAVQRDVTLDASNLSALHSDGWDGYPNTLREVLAHIAANKLHQVVFLSGDEHRGCVATADLFDAAGCLITRVHSIHSTALYAPYPFSNCTKEEVVSNETISIVHCSGTYQCVVNATHPPNGDGSTFVFVRKCDDLWKLNYEYADGAVQTITLSPPSDRTPTL